MTSSWIIYSFLILGTGILCNGRLERRQAVSSCSINNDDNFVCTNGTCIEWSLVCDGHKHCSDGSDETKELCGRYEYETNMKMDCGTPHKIIHEIPWLVYIHRVDNIMQSTHYELGLGSIIASNVVVAMAETFWRSDLKYKQNSINDDGRYMYFIETAIKPQIKNPYNINAKMIYFVEDYNISIVSNADDLAVIVLADKISFSNGVSPICIDWYSKYSGRNYYDQYQIFRILRRNEHNFAIQVSLLNDHLHDYLHIDNSSCQHLYDTYTFADSVTYDKFCIRIIMNISEKLDGEKFHYQTLNILQSNHFFLTGLKSYWSKINNDDALGFIDIKYYIPWIRGILIKHGTVNSCILQTVEGVVYTHKGSHETLSAGTFINPGVSVNENCEVGYHKVNTNGSRFCQENGKWLSNSTKLCVKMCPPLLSDSLDIKCTLNDKNVNCSNLSMPDTTATLSCKPTFSTPNRNEETPQEIHCQSNGIWNKQLFSCKPSNVCVLPNIEGVVYTYDDSNKSVSHGALINPGIIVNENCEVGYHQAFLYSFRICQKNGKWKTIPQELCLKMCPPLLSDSLDIKCTLNDKNVNCSNLSMPNTTATLSCKPTFSAPNGNEDTPHEIYCQSNGIWNKQLFSCKPSNVCVLPNIEGVVYTYEASNESLSHGTFINHTVIVNENCEVGYHQAHLGRFRICQNNGKWKTVSGKLCSKMCPPLLSDSLNIKCTLNDKDINCSNLSIPNTTATLSCKPAYSAPHGQEDTPHEIHCQSNGIWNKKLYTCKPNCGNVYISTEQLIDNGRNTSVGTAPWNVGIYLLNENNLNYELICGGSIIGPNLVVSAAHCFWNKTITNNTISVNDDRYKIAIGKYTRDITKNDNKFTEIMNVGIVYLKPSYNGVIGFYAEDIAIVVLKKKITFNDGVAPVCIDLNGQYNVKQGDQGKIVGWGKTEKDIDSPILLEAYLQYYNNSVCRKIFSTDYETYVTYDKFCAGSTSVSGQRVNKGDSGAGLCFLYSKSYYLTGVVSSKYAETKYSIAVFTEIKSHIEWIRGLLSKHN